MNIFKRILKSTVAVAVFVSVIMSVTVYIPNNVITVSAADKKITESDIKAIEDKIAANQNKIESYQAKIDSLRDSIAAEMDIKIELEQQIIEIENNIKDIDAQIKLYETYIAEKEILILEEEKDLSSKYDDFLERLRVSYEDGTQNYLELFVNSESLIEFITRSEKLGSVLEYEKSIMDDLEASLGELNEMKAGLVEKKEVYVRLGQELDESKQQLDSKNKEQDEIISKLNQDKEAAQKSLTSAQKNDQIFENQLQETIKKYNEQQITAATGSFLWPVDAKYTKVSSKYGWRVIFGEKDFHKGIDIPAPKGAKIYAANDGVVMNSQYGGSYGNYVLINHGGDRATLYAHCSKLLVKAGQNVKRGDIIAEVGSTGRSTGNHLHFEVRLNGSTTDPLVKGMLLIRSGNNMVDPVANNLLRIS